MTAWRWLGLVLQLAGYATVARGIVNLRRQYSDRPGAIRTARSTANRWYRRAFRRQRNQTIELSGTGSVSVTGRPTLTQTFAAPDRTAPLDERLTELERQVRHLEQRHNHLTGSFADEVARRDAALAAEKEAREQLDASFRQDLRNLASGGLRTEAYGVAAIMIGTILTTVG